MQTPLKTENGQASSWPFSIRKEEDKMEMTDIMSLIGSLGFPIVVAIYMIYVNREQSSKHADEVKGMTEAIKN